MFTVDSIPAKYFEAREADDAVRRQAYLQKQQAALANALAAKQAAGPSPPAATPRLRAPETATIFGNLFHGFVRSMPGSTPSSGASTPVPGTPLHTPQKIMTQAEIEALIAEKRKEFDKVSLPGWY